MAFKVGDIVKLKSGGPPMTVEKADDSRFDSNYSKRAPRYLCQWFAGSKLSNGYFEPEVLEKVDTSPAPKGKKG